MPATSKKQYELMKAVEHGWQKGPKGLSQAEAKEYVKPQPTAKGLPEKAKPSPKRRR